MNKNDLSELLKKCFGKEKDDRYHAIAMLIIYGIFFIFVVVFIRTNSSSINKSTTNTDTSTTASPTTSSVINNDNSNTEDNNSYTVENDINYSYSYTINYNNSSEVYIGKKIDDKEKFTLVKDNNTVNYAKLDDNYLILKEDNIYHITETPSKFLKYCDTDTILTMVEKEILTENSEGIKYSVSNASLSKAFNDNIIADNELENTIKLTITDNTLKSIYLDLSNYINSIGDNSSLTINMEFVDIGTTEDFEIKVS